MKTLDISGFGGAYEDACQTMLTSGLEWLADHYEPCKLQYTAYKDVFGLLTAENDFSKEFDQAVCAGVEPTGAMHHAVVGHVLYILRSGYDGWLKQDTGGRSYEREDHDREKAVKALIEAKMLAGEP